jgi:hypothetical protein
VYSSLSSYDLFREIDTFVANVKRQSKEIRDGESRESRERRLEASCEMLEGLAKLIWKDLGNNIIDG